MKISLFRILDQLIDRKFKKNGLVLQQKKMGKFDIEYLESDNDLPVMVLLHAFGPNGKYTWYKQVRAFSKHYKLIIPSMSFFGQSTMDPKSYHASDQVEGIKLLLNELKIKKFTIGSASFGAAIACEIGLLDEFEIEKFFISNSPVKYSADYEWTPTLDKIGASKKSELLVPRNHNELSFLYKTSRYKLCLAPAFVFKGVYKNIYMYQAEDRAKLMDQFIVDQIEMVHHNYDFSFPVLVIWGENDILSPIEMGERLNKHFGENSRLTVVPKCGHMPNIERPYFFNSAVLKFLIGDEK